MTAGSSERFATACPGQLLRSGGDKSTQYAAAQNRALPLKWTQFGRPKSSRGYR